MEPLRLPTERDRDEVVILADGDYPSGVVASALLRNAARVVCCDGAAASFIARGGDPYAIVGDCDSLPAELRERYAAVLHHETEQEHNDQTKAVRYCLAAGMTHLTILGATGKREDHTLGNISLLADYRAMGARVRMVTDRGVFDPLREEEIVFESFPGQQVSIFSLDPHALVSGEGLVYPLPERLNSWWCGTLNEAIGDSFTVCSSGAMIVYRLF